MNIPTFNILSKLTGTSFDLFSGTRPLFNITSAYVRSNLGDSKVVYIDPAQGDPLPRDVMFGLSGKLGLSMQTNARTWELISFTLAREAEDVLVTWFPSDTIRDANGGIVALTDPRFEYQDGSGDLSFFTNTVLSESNGNVWLRRGWQVNLAELLNIRGGSVEAPGLRYTTSGFSFRLRGIFNLLETLNDAEPDSPVLAFIANHVDIQFDHASESSDGPRNGTSYNGFNFTLK
jgi:hypothetical protein